MPDFKPKAKAISLLKEYKGRIFILGNSENGTLLFYDSNTGTFEENELQLKQIISDRGSSRIHQVEEITRFIRLHAPRKAREEFDQSPNLIVLRNGVLDMASNKLLPHSPKNLCRVSIPHDFDPQASCPRFEKFLGEILPPNYHPLIEELVGAALFGDTSHERIFLLFGCGANGKSVLAKTTVALLGPQNVSSSSLHDLTDNRFAAADLEGKRLNVCTDIDSRSPKSLHLLKALTSGDPIRAERKYQTPFSFVNSALMLFSCNQLPNFSEAGDAIARRFIVVPFRQTFSKTKADLELLSKLTTESEMSGILNRAIAGYRRLQERGSYSVPEESERIWRSHVGELDPIQEFLGECTFERRDARTPKKELYQEYVNFCKGDWTPHLDYGAGIRPQSRSRFNAAVRRFYPGASESKMGGMDRRNCWVGIAVKSGDDRSEPLDIASLHEALVQ